MKMSSMVPSAMVQLPQNYPDIEGKQAKVGTTLTVS